MMRICFIGTRFVTRCFGHLGTVRVEFGSGVVWRTVVYEVDLDKENSEQVFETVGRILVALRQAHEVELRPAFTIAMSATDDQRYQILKRALTSYCESEWKRMLTVSAVEDAIQALKNSRTSNPDPDIGQIRLRLERGLKHIEECSVH